MAEPSSSLRDQTAPMALPPDSSDMVVLLVDDEAAIAEAIRRVLVDEPSVNFHYCSNSSDALSVARKVRPTVILQDLVMPCVDGLTLVRQYRAAPDTRDIPMIVLSTKEEATVRNEAFGAGANDYLVKLPDAIELVARIRYHSRACLNQIQRDEAYRALHESKDKLRQMNIELQRLNNIDGLTGLRSRRYFDDFAGAQWKLAIREQKPFSILMVDVDDFKLYNDNYGHIAGDEVLKRIATAMHESFTRPTDLPARFGGEEFVVLLPATPLAALQRLGERLRDYVENMNIPHKASTVGKWVTVSLGGASAKPRLGDSYIRFIQNTHDALHRAKRSGKNRVAMHD